MIAMQYDFVLPADYDMTIIDRRIAEKGRFTDGLPGLVFKAYLSSRKTDPVQPACDNRYAPFYLWESSAGMNDFLSGPGFVAVTQSFGWPSLKTWSVWHAEVSEQIAEARYATRELIPIRPHSSLGELRADEQLRAREVMKKPGALVAVCGFEPTSWSIVRFQLWKEMPQTLPAADYCVYVVGHVSQG